MNSIKYPDMFNSSSTNVAQGLEASKQDLVLLLSSEKGELLGDPYFGVKVKRYYYDQNDIITRDLIADEIWSQLRVFAPQLTVLRGDVKVWGEGKTLYASVKAINNVDYTTNMYQVKLLEGDER